MSIREEIEEQMLQLANKHWWHEIDDKTLVKEILSIPALKVVDLETIPPHILVSNRREMELVKQVKDAMLNDG